jgi:hypothetical protein
MSDERKGYRQAVIDALRHAAKEWVFVVDSDYQFAAIDFRRLEPFRRDADVILGIKRPRRDPFYRVWLSWGFNVLFPICLKQFMGILRMKREFRQRGLRPPLYHADAPETESLTASRNP